MIKLSSDIVIFKENLKNLIDFIYLNLIKNSANANYFVGRIILILKNIHIDEISDTIIEKFSGEIHIYSSMNLVDLTENSNTDQPQIYSFKFLRSLKIFRLPSSELKLKIGVLIILL